MAPVAERRCSVAILPKGLLTVAVILAVLAPAHLTLAQTFTVLYSFKGSPDGALPVAALIRDPVGNLYGVTDYGGKGYSFPRCLGSGCGTVYELNPATGQETLLYSFNGSPDGANPDATLLRDSAGNLYGTTSWGGDAFDDGTIFKFSRSGEVVAHKFALSDGTDPLGGLIADSSGNGYGMTFGGGASFFGVVYSVSRTGAVQVLHSFAGSPTDGYGPIGNVLRDSSGKSLRNH